MLGKLNDQQRKLAEDYLPVARSLSRGLKKKIPYLWEEFESAACLALVTAARDYDESYNIRFATFAMFRIREILTKVGEKEKYYVSFRPYMESEGKVLFSSEIEDIDSELESRDAVEAILGKLPPKYAYVCRRYYIDEMTQSEIAMEINCSESQVGNFLRKSLKLLGKTTSTPKTRNRPKMRIHSNG